MSAEIHRLHPPKGEEQGRSSASQQQDAVGKAIATELKARACSLLSERLQRMFDGADDLLFEMSEKALSNDERRVYFDTMRVIRLERPRLAQSFDEQLAACFEPGYRPGTPQQATDEIDFDRVTLQDSETLEQSIAIANMESKVQSLYRHTLWEIERRLETLCRLSDAPISSRAFAPAGLCQAFRSATDSLSVSFEIRLVIYKLFDRLVIGDLATVYAEALSLLDAHGIQAPRGSRHAAGKDTAADVSAQAPTAADLPAPEGGSGAPGGLPYAAASLIDAYTLAALNQVGHGGRRAPRFYDDAVLASELAAAARGQPVYGLQMPQAWASVQRAGLVGRMFNDILADPHMPGSIKPLFDELRFPAIKAALRDARFFSDPQQPVRALINELASMAASSRAAEPEVQAHMRELVRQVRSQFDVAADQVRPAVEQAQAVAESDIERFLEAQLEQGRARRRAILDKAKRVVAQELEIHTLGRALPARVWPLLHSGWAPMMGVTLLRQGLGSEQWNHGVELLRRTVRSLVPAPTTASEEAAAERLAITEALRVRLIEVGMPAARSVELLDGLTAAYAEIDARARQAAGRAQEQAEAGEPPPAPSAEPEEALPTPQQLLQLLLTPGAWFRIFDREHGDTRWLKVTVYDELHGRVAFAEFDGRNALTLDGVDLFDDLMARRSEPIDPSPAARHALRRRLAARGGQAPAQGG